MCRTASSVGQTYKKGLCPALWKKQIITTSYMEFHVQYQMHLSSSIEMKLLCRTSASNVQHIGQSSRIYQWTFSHAQSTHSKETRWEMWHQQVSSNWSISAGDAGPQRWWGNLVLPGFNTQCNQIAYSVHIWYSWGESIFFPSDATQRSKKMFRNTTSQSLWQRRFNMHRMDICHIPSFPTAVGKVCSSVY